MRRPATILKAVSSAAAILILAAGCTQSPTAPAQDAVSAPSAPSAGLYLYGGG